MKAFYILFACLFSVSAFAEDSSLYVRTGEGLMDVATILESEADIHGFDNYCYLGDPYKVTELIVEWHKDEWFFAGGGGSHILEYVGVNNWHPHAFIFGLFRSEVTGEVQTEYFNHCSLAKEDKPMSRHMQESYVLNVAKELRREFWQSGHEDVESSIELMTDEKLNEYVKKENNSTYEIPLTREQISKLYQCYHRDYCEVYLIGISGSHMGGYGQEAFFTLLNTKKRTHQSISHMVYAE